MRNVQTYESYEKTIVFSGKRNANLVIKVNP